MSAPLDGIKQLEANDAGPEEENIRVNHYTDPSFHRTRLSDCLFGESSASQSRNRVGRPSICKTGRSVALQDESSPDLHLKELESCPRLACIYLFYCILFIILFLIGFFFLFIFNC